MNMLIWHFNVPELLKRHLMEMNISRQGLKIVVKGE